MTPPKNEKKNTPAPTVEKMGLKIKRLKPTDHIKTALKKISFLTVENGGASVTARHVESVDMKKQPFHYWQATFAPEHIELEWTVQPTQTSIQRKIHVTKNLLELLCLLEQAYPASASHLRPLILENIEAAQNDFFKNNGQLALDNDTMRRQLRQMEKQKKDFETTLERLNQQNTELSQENDEFKKRLTKMDHISDDYLKTKIMESIVQNAEFKPQTLATALQLPYSRIENALEELVKLGFLQPIK